MNAKRTVVILVAAAVFGGVGGLNSRIAHGMTTCWNLFGEQIDLLSQRYQVSQSLVLAVVYHESGCNRNAVRFEPHVYNWPTVVRMAKGNEAERRFLASSYGLMQVLGVTARGMGYTGGYDEFKNRSLEYGIRYLRIKRDQWGSWDHALAAYNGGDAAVSRRRVGGAYSPRIALYVRSVHVLRDRYANRIIQAWLDALRQQVRGWRLG